jgi:hypothetical protein
VGGKDDFHGLPRRPIFEREYNWDDVEVTWKSSLPMGGARHLTTELVRIVPFPAPYLD